MNRFKRVAGAAWAFYASAAATPALAADEVYVFGDLFAVQHEERIPERQTGVGGRIGAGVPLGADLFGPTAVEIGAFANPIKHSGGGGKAGQLGLMADLVQDFTLGGLTPYVLAGVGFVNEHVAGAKGPYLGLEAGAGLKFKVFTDARLRVGVTAMSVHNDEIAAGQDSFIDWRFNVGLMGGGGTATPAVARALDSDGDGLVDTQDRCPTEAASTADGCPAAAPVARTDSDNDGVYDEEDGCPGTLGGLKVDARGCAVQTEAQSVVLKGVTFLPGSATLTEEAKVVLENAVTALSGQADLKVELGGHTDAQGADAANLKLSQRRAESVRQYLVGKGIAADRLVAKGYGETQPIAGNDTPAGRAENRRVELKIAQ